MRLAWCVIVVGCAGSASPHGRASSTPTLGRYMCQVEVDDGRWDSTYPCEIGPREWAHDDPPGRYDLRASVDFTGHKVAAEWIELPGRMIVVRRGQYDVDEAHREAEDYGYCVKATLYPEGTNWVGVLEFDDCGGGARTEKWEGQRRLAVRRRPWPPGFQGKMW